MSKKYRRLYETAFDSKISKSDEDLLSAEKQDAVIAHRMSDQLQLSASTSSVQQQCGGGGGGGDVVIVRASSSARLPYKSRLFGFLLHQKRRNSMGPPQRYANYGGKYPSSDSVVTSSSVSLESITSDSLSSHSSESPCYKSRFPEPHVLSPISDKSSQDATVAAAPITNTVAAAAVTNITTTADAVVAQTQAKTKPPQSLGLIKLNRDHHQHHGSDSGISVGSKPGDNSYQELLDLPFDMPKLRRKRFESEASRAGGAPLPPESLPFDMPKLRRKQMDSAGALPFDVPELRRRQTDRCATVISSDFEIGTADGCVSERLEDEDPFDVANPKAISGRTHDRGSANKPDRNNLFLDVTPNSRCVAVVNAINKLSPKTFQNKSKLFLCFFLRILCTVDFIMRGNYIFKL